MDLVVFLVLLVLVLFLCKDLKSFVYFIGIVDVFLKLLHFVKVQVNVYELTVLIDKYFPSSVLGIVGKYVNGILYDVFVWLYVVCIAMFLFYLIKYFFKRK